MQHCLPGAIATFLGCIEFILILLTFKAYDFFSETGKTYNAALDDLMHFTRVLEARGFSFKKNGLKIDPSIMRLVGDIAKKKHFNRTQSEIKMLEKYTALFAEEGVIIDVTPPSSSQEISLS